MNSNAIIADISKELGQPIEAVELAAHISAPYLARDGVTLCPKLAKKLRADITAKLKRATSSN